MATSLHRLNRRQGASRASISAELNLEGERMSADLIESQNLSNRGIELYQPRRVQLEEPMHINPLLTLGLALAAGISAVRDRGQNFSAFAMGLLIGIAFRSATSPGDSVGR
jgi:hypothetical protein